MKGVIEISKERKASVIYTSNGTQLTFSFPFDYLQKSFVKAQVISGSDITELVQGTDYSVEDRQLTLSKAVAKDSLLKIYRETTTETIVSWNDASVLRAKDMSIQEVQLLHLAEETADKVFDSGMSTAPTNTNVWDGQYKRITNLLDPQEDGDAMTLRYANDKQHGLITALKNEGATQDAGLKSTGDSQNTRLTNTGNTQNTRLATTGDTQNKRLTDTGDSYVATMTTLKDTATTQASNASQSASNASASASTASTQATNAGKSASNASASATTASTKATEASNSANLSKAWAMSDSSPDGVSGNKSSKTWANEAKNSASNAATSASTATAKATEATAQATNAASSASAAAKSAEDAKLFDPATYYSKTEVDTKISTAHNYIKRNTAYKVGDILESPNLPHGYLIVVTQAGTTGSSEPDWTTIKNALGGVVSDGTVQFYINDTLSKHALGDIVYKPVAKIGEHEYLLPLDGQALDTTKYKRLVDYLGSSTLPNLNGRYLRADTTPNTMVNAGLPNITGTVITKAAWSNGGSNGAFSDNVKSYAWTDGEYNQTLNESAFFDASRCSPIYGSSSTVTPLTYTVRVYICYA